MAALLIHYMAPIMFMALVVFLLLGYPVAFSLGAVGLIFVCALLAATTGVVAASVISMGLISLPIMLRYGYDRRVASGVIAASGTLAQIIPPSLVLIVMADQLGKSVGDMYEGAFIPGLV